MLRLNCKNVHHVDIYLPCNIEVNMITGTHLGVLALFFIKLKKEINTFRLIFQPEALKSLYRSPGNKKKQLVLCKNYVLRHLGITINIKNTKFVKDLPMIDAQFRFNQCNSFREEYISVFSPYGSVLIL